jgi:hypothetical protein
MFHNMVEEHLVLIKLLKMLLPDYESFSGLSTLLIAVNLKKHDQRTHIVAFTSLLFLLLINIVIHIYCIIIVHGSELSSNIM